MSLKVPPAQTCPCVLLAAVYRVLQMTTRLVQASQLHLGLCSSVGAACLCSVMFCFCVSAWFCIGVCGAPARLTRQGQAASITSAILELLQVFAQQQQTGQSMWHPLKQLHVS